MKKTVLIFLPVLLLMLLVIFPKKGQAKPVPDIDIELDRPFYSTTDTVNLKISLLGRADDGKKSRIRLQVFDRVPPESSLIKVKTKNKRSIFRQTWFEELSAESKELEFKKDLSQVTIGEGVYPVEVSIDLKKSKQIKERVFLIILNPRTEQLPIALVWDWHHPPQQSQSDIFFDDGLIDKIGNLKEPGIYLNYTSLIRNSSNIKFNLAIAPSLLNEIQRAADGYRLKSENKLKLYGPDSSHSLAGKKLLNDLRDISKDKDKTDVLSVPFGYPYLPVILDAGWETDFDNQIKKGRNTLASILQLQTVDDTWLAPGLKLDKNSASRLTNFGAKTIIFDDDFFQRRSKSFFAGPFEINGDDNQSKGYLADPEFSYIISKISKDKIKNWLNALIAMRLLSMGDEKNIEVAVMGAEDNKPVNLEIVKAVLDVFGTNPWVKTENISKLASSASKKNGVLASNGGDPPVDLEYFTDLSQARQEVIDFSETVSKDNPLRKSLETNLLKAQTYSLLSKGGFPGKEKETDFLKEIKQTIDETYSRIRIASTQTITFSGAQGKIPIAITNGNDYPVNLTLILDGGKDFSFSDDKKSKVKIMPKENLLVHEVTANFRGRGRIKVSLSAGNREINKAQITVAVSDMAKNVLNIVSVISLLLAAILIIRSRIRGRNV